MLRIHIYLTEFDMINILLVDQQKLFADCFSLIFRKRGIGIRLLATVNNCKEGFLLLGEGGVDLILINTYMVDTRGFGEIDYLKTHFPKVKIIIISEVDNVEFLQQLWMKGVDSILSKKCGIDTIVETIKQVYIGQKIIGKHIPNFYNYNICLNHSQGPKLSPREQEVLNLLSTGLTRKEVSDKLFVSIETVHFHCKNLLKKFGLNKMYLLIEKAKELKLISQE